MARSKHSLGHCHGSPPLLPWLRLDLSDCLIQASLFLLFRYRSSFSSPAGVQNRCHDIDQNHWCASNWKRSCSTSSKAVNWELIHRWIRHTAWQSVDILYYLRRYHIHFPWYTSTKRLEKENHFTDSNSSTLNFPIKHGQRLPLSDHISPSSSEEVASPMSSKVTLWLPASARISFLLISSFLSPSTRRKRKLLKS